MSAGVRPRRLPEAGLPRAAQPGLRLDHDQRVHVASQYPGILLAAVDHADHIAAARVSGRRRQKIVLQTLRAQQLRQGALPAAIERHRRQRHHQSAAVAAASPGQLELPAVRVQKEPRRHGCRQIEEAELQPATAASAATATAVPHGAGEVSGGSVVLQKIAICAEVHRIVQLILVLDGIQKSRQLRHQIHHAQLGGEHGFLGRRVCDDQIARD